jgi:CheY-like chemotaxis protein
MNVSETSFGATPTRPIPASLPHPEASVGGRPRLLWVDDCAPLLSLYKAVFESHGFEVLTTTSAQESLRMLESMPISAAILDYDMPEMNGGILASLIKKLSPGLPVILHSGNPDIPDYAKFCVDAVCPKTAPRQELKAAIDHLAKPFDFVHQAPLPQVFSPSSKSI